MEFIEENDEDYNVTIFDSNRHAALLTVSGANSLDKACNIYDLEGNYREYIADLYTEEELITMHHLLIEIQLQEWLIKI